MSDLAFLAFQLLTYASIFNGCLGYVIYRNRARIQVYLARRKWSPFFKFALPCYAMVLFEETIVGVTYAIKEGFTITLAIERTLQFWCLNTLAFSGLIIGWYLLSRVVNYSLHEKLFLGGLYSILPEQTLAHIFSKDIFNPLWAFIVLIYGVMAGWAYALILYPGFLSTSDHVGKRLERPLRLLLAFLVPFAIGLPFLFVIDLIRQYLPMALPLGYV